MAEHDVATLVIVLGSFLAAVSNAAFSSGGAMIVLAVTSTVLPVAAVVPIHSTLLIGSTSSRAFVFRDHVDWRISGPFLVGSLAAVAIASRLYFSLPEKTIAVAIALVMLVAIWLPAVSWRPRVRHPWAIVGFVHSFLSTLFAYGALLHAVILHTRLTRRQIVGTMAVALTGMSIFKITGYTLNGFDYTPYLMTIALSVAAAFVGTWVGKLIIDRVSEKTFRFVFRALVTLTAIRLLYLSIANS
ncbi:MAG: sulfite exporter TauE/SafE family protein [Gammaproteobacteria bacterium]|nr:sulfite exporter TauE/SafE family protein [Gammaproteobacteria bacterium]